MATRQKRKYTWRGKWKWPWGSDLRPVERVVTGLRRMDRRMRSDHVWKWCGPYRPAVDAYSTMLAYKNAQRRRGYR